MSWKNLLINTVKFGLMAAILGFLFWQAFRNNAYGNLANQSKNWPMLGVALALCMTAVTLTLVRWHLLLRAVGINCRLTETLRFGFVGFLFNLAPMGIVGGDVIKAIMIGRNHDKQYAKTVASAFVDRALGLWVLFLVALAAMYATGFWRIDSPTVQTAHYAMLALAGMTTIVFAVILAPDLSNGATLRLVERLPVVGPKILKLAESVRLYRNHLGTLGVATVMSVGVHVLLALGVCCIGAALYEVRPSLPHHIVISPVSFATGAIPLPAGPFEAVLDKLYPTVPSVVAGTVVQEGQGFVIALCYRIITLVIASVGLVFYLSSRNEVQRVLHEQNSQRVLEGDDENLDELEASLEELKQGSVDSPSPASDDHEDEQTPSASAT